MGSCWMRKPCPLPPSVFVCVQVMTDIMNNVDNDFNYREVAFILLLLPTSLLLLSSHVYKLPVRRCASCWRAGGKRCPLKGIQFCQFVVVQYVHSLFTWFFSLACLCCVFSIQLCLHLMWFAVVQYHLFHLFYLYFPFGC